MDITSAQYIELSEPNGGSVYLTYITATIDGIQMSVPLDPANRHYAEIMRQVEEGTLTIADAEE